MTSPDGLLGCLCAAAGGKAPPNAADFLPWNMSEEFKEAMSAPFLGIPDVHDSS
jgi:hypothetical protein